MPRFTRESVELRLRTDFPTQAARLDAMRETPVPTVAPPALKEWSLVCDLLLAGRQAVLFRKGGINEKGFWVEAPEFFLFPTYFHQNRDKVRDEFRADFDRAMAAAPPDGLLRMGGYARVFEAIEVRRPERIGELRDLHPYSGDQIEGRIEFRPKKPLVVLVVQVFPLREPSESPMREDYAGCVSWVEPGLPRPDLGAPIKSNDELRAIADRIRRTVG